MAWLVQDFLRLGSWSGRSGAVSQPRLAPILALAVLTACSGPVGPIPGGRLGGTPVPGRVTDWSFARNWKNAEVETNPSDPHSVTVNYFLVGERLYLETGQEGDWNRWRRYIRADPRVRVRFGDDVYSAVAVVVTDPEELRAVRQACAEKRGKPPADGATFMRLD